MLISEQYRALNVQLHKDRPDYGISGSKYVQQVQDLARATSATSILDYGCGKRTLERALGYAISNYDPAVAGCEAAPVPADLVVCTDVLEHIEPDCLDAVLDDLKRVTLKALILTVAMIPAKKVLADGRNAHQIIEDQRFWIPKLLERFKLINFYTSDREFFAVLAALTATAPTTHATDSRAGDVGPFAKAAA